MKTAILPKSKAMLLQRLNSMDSQQVTDRIQKALRNHSSSAEILFNGSLKDLGSLLSESVLKDPEFFYISGFRFRSAGSLCTVMPVYLYDKEETARLHEECSRRAALLLKRAADKNPYETVLAFHDLLARNIEYCNDGRPERHSIAGPFTEKKAVCDGYAKALKYLLDHTGIENCLVHGSAWNAETGLYEPHAWNLVQLDGHWFHVDVTFDAVLGDSKILRHDYFCLTNGQILRDHRYECSSFPEADFSGYDYYSKFSLVMKGKETFKSRVLHCLEKGESDLIVKLPDEVSEEGLENKVTSVLNRTLLDSDIRCSYSLSFNLKQRIFHIHVMQF